VSFAPLLATWREWVIPVAVAVVLGLPQWFLAVSTPYWDEAASSAIHLTAANQFAEGLFPPRHNAFPDVPILYHYGFIVLSGTVRWLTGLSANASIDVASTALWLFTFLFAFYWLRDLAFSRIAAGLAAFTVLLGGGLTWLYVRWIEAYNGFEIAPGSTLLVHRYDESVGVIGNLLRSAMVPSAYLRNSDGTVSNLPWDIAAQFQQHAVALGLPLTLLAFWAFVRWMSGASERRTAFAVAVAVCGVLMLAHAVFGGTAALTAGIVMLLDWGKRPSWRAIVPVAAFTFGVSVLFFAHGGPLAVGEAYGASTDVLTLRDGFGYPSGGLAGFINWNIAGFGIPLVLAIIAWITRPIRLGAAVPAGEGRTRDAQRATAFLVFTVFAILAYIIPQFAFYTSESSGVERFTEISKFFFAAHLGFAMLSAFGASYLERRFHWGVFVPAAAAMAVAPLVFAYVHSTTALRQFSAPPAAARADSGYRWLGFYHAPYYRGSVEEHMGDTLRARKRSNRDTYFDASGDERRHHYLGELLLFGGSVFTASPSRYERTGSGFRLSGDLVAARMKQHGRMSRLLPGAAEACACTWYYARPATDLFFAPMVTRSRFERLVAEGYFVLQHLEPPRALYSIEKPTDDLDANLHLYWRPRVVSQVRTDWDGDGRNDLIFLDPVNRQVIAGNTTVAYPESATAEFTQLFVGRFPGDGRVSLLFGRTKDTEFRFGRRIDDIVEYSSWGWSWRPAGSARWEPEYERWFWDGDMPLIGDIDNDGFDTHLMYRPRTGEWFAAPMRKLAGPSADATALPIPFVGRFLPGSTGDLAVWNRSNGVVTMQSLSTGSFAQFSWGGHPGEVLVPGDYDGDGYDEIAVWNGTNQFWYYRDVMGGSITRFRFGTATSVPVPADYNDDGRVDPAYWEPAARAIFVTFNQGRSIDRVIPVPPGAIPAYVNMH
jgi:hypothetical protein